MRALFPEYQKGALQVSRGSGFQHTEALCQLMSRFRKHFTTVHVERKCVDGISICVICHSAMETLAKIRKAISKNPHGPDLVLRDEEFMKLLVKLSMLDSSGLPRICSVTCRETRTFYATGEYRRLNASVSVHEDGAGEKLWEGILGKAAEAIRLPTYTVNIHGSHLPGRRSCVWHRTGAKEPLGDVPRSNAPRNEPEVNPFPKSDLRTWNVVRCLDARHLLVYRCAAGRGGADSLNNMLAECHRDSRPREDRPEVGEIMGLFTSNECMLRVLVVGVVNDTAVVWSVDEGNFHKLPWCDLVDLLPSFKCLPPAIGLGVIPDVNAAPFLGLLRECIRTLQAVANLHDVTASLHNVKIRRLTSLGVVEVLSNLLDCLDCVTRMASAACLIQLCKLQSGSRAVSEAGCVQKVRGRLRKLAEQHRRDPQALVTEGKTLVNLLSAMFFCNEKLRLQYADFDDVALLIEIRECSLSGNNFSKAVQHCLEILLGPHDESRRPVSAKLVAMRPEQLRNWDSLHSPCKAMQHCYGPGAGPARAGPQSAGNKCASSMPPPQGSIQAPSGRCYLRGTMMPFRSDKTRELRPSLDLKLESVRTLAQIICSFLNTWQLCTIFYGITSDGLVRGVRLSYRDRDTVRLGIDSATHMLRPCLIPQSLAVNFVPVLRSTQDVYEAASHFVVEILVRGVPRTVYNIKGVCYLREYSRSYKAVSQDVRAWIAQLEETYYLQAQEPLPIETSQIP